MVSGHLTIRSAKALGTEERDRLKKPALINLIIDDRLQIDIAKQLTRQQIQHIEAGFVDDVLNEIQGAQRAGGDCRIM